MARSFEFNNSDNVMDVRDIIARTEELEEERQEKFPELDDWDGQEELDNLNSLLDDLRGNGGDEQWRGDWYPITLIRDSYMQDYAQEMAEECCEMPTDLRWPYTCIDWEQATREFKMDYTTIEIDDVTYWYR